VTDHFALPPMVDDDKRPVVVDEQHYNNNDTINNGFVAMLPISARKHHTVVWNDASMDLDLS
jgi:hypothetical protein